MLCRAVENYALLNLRPGANSPYNSCMDYQRFASAIALNSQSAPTTCVHEDNDRITYLGKTFSIKAWRTGLQRLATEIEQELTALTLGQDKLLQKSVQVEDDWSDETRGYSWVHQGQFVNNKLQLLKTMLLDPSSKLAIIENEEFQFHASEVWKFLHACDALNEKLALFTLFTAGAAPRITEFVEHKYANSTRGRNLFMDGDQQLWIVNRRTKVETQVKRETFIPKKCHPLLTTFLIKYFTLIRPTECALVDYIKGPQAAIIYSEYMWVKGGGHLSETYFYSLMDNFLEKYCNVKMNSRDYRQVHVELGRIFLGSEAEIDEEKLDVLAEQAGHSSRMAQLNYATEVGHLPRMSSDLLLRFGRISEAWWEITGFKPNTPPMLTLKERRLIKHNLDLGTHAAPSGLPLAFDSSTLIQVMTATLREEMQNFKQEIKAMIHNEVQMAMAEALTLLPSTSICPSVTPPTIDSREDETMDIDDIYVGYQEPGYQPTATSKAYLEGLLQQHFPLIANPKFKSMLQMEALELAISKTKVNFVAVMPTGSGKSLLFTLPPFHEPGSQTYCVVPNVALLQDHLSRAQKLGLRTHVWTTAACKVPPDIQLVFLAMESAASEKFRM